MSDRGPRCSASRELWHALYFGHFTTMLRDDEAGMAGAFDANGSNRRPPRDPVNCLLSCCYSLLIKDLVAVCLGVGLDHFIGVLHAPRFGRPALAWTWRRSFGR